MQMNANLANREYKCNTCGAILASKSSLNQHVKTAKFCLNIKGETGKFNCASYDKPF